jgi:hypothetical protein
MKNIHLFLSALIYSFSINSFAQTTNPSFQKTVDSINCIIKANKLAYYSSEKQYSTFITKISVTEQGIVHFTDSIPKPEKTAVPSKSANKQELIPDCCPPKNARTLDLFTIKEWEIYFPSAYLKDKNNENIGKFLGFKKPDLEQLKKQLEHLKSLCKKGKATDTK